MCQTSRCPRCWRCRSRRRRTRWTRCQSPPTSPDCPSSWSPSAVLRWGQFAKNFVLVMKKTRSPPALHPLLHPHKLLEVSLPCALQPGLTKYNPATLSHWIHHQHVPTRTYTRAQTQTRTCTHTRTRTRTCIRKHNKRARARPHTNAHVHTRAGYRQVRNWRSLRV